MAPWVTPTPNDADNFYGSFTLAARSDWRFGDADSMSARASTSPHQMPDIRLQAQPSPPDLSISFLSWVGSPYTKVRFHATSQAPQLKPLEPQQPALSHGAGMGDTERPLSKHLLSLIHTTTSAELATKPQPCHNLCSGTAGRRNSRVQRSQECYSCWSVEEGRDSPSRCSVAPLVWSVKRPSRVTRHASGRFLLGVDDRSS